MIGRAEFGDRCSSLCCSILTQAISLKAAVVHEWSADCLFFVSVFQSCCLSGAQCAICARWMGSDCEEATSKVGDVPKREKARKEPIHQQASQPRILLTFQHDSQAVCQSKVAADAAEEVHKLEAAVQVLGGKTMFTRSLSSRR